MNFIRKDARRYPQALVLPQSNDIRVQPWRAEAIYSALANDRIGYGIIGSLAFFALGCAYRSRRSEVIPESVLPPQLRLWCVEGASSVRGGRRGVRLWSSGSSDPLISSSQAFRCLSSGVMNHQTVKSAWTRWKIFSSSSKSVQNPMNRPIDYQKTNHTQCISAGRTFTSWSMSK